MFTFFTNYVIIIVEVNVMKTIIRRVPDEDVYYDWNDWVDLTEESEDIVILGDHHYVLFGDSKAVDIVKGDHYDDEIDPETSEALGYDYETIDELDKVMGGDWEYTEFKGYSQGDWVRVWYNKEKVTEGLLEELDNFIMGKVDEYTVQESEDEDDVYHVFIPHDICWKGKEAICEHIGIKPEEATVLEDNGYTKVYNYVEVQ